MDPFLKKKWEHVFAVFFDTNKSHTLEWHDFELMIEKVKQMRGAASDDYRVAQTALKEVWEGLAAHADSNKDNKVSIEEWNQMWISTAKGQNPKWQDDYLRYMFMLLDASGDQKIDENEYATIMSMHGISDSDARQSFKKFATTQDGGETFAVDFQGFSALWNEYFHSKDSAAPGNFLFGPIN